MFFNTLRLFVWWFYIEFLCITPLCKKRNDKEASKVVALLSYCLPPQFNSGTHRPLSFIKYAKGNNWKIFAITNSNVSETRSEAGQQLFKEVPSGVAILQFSDRFGDTSWRFTPELDGGFKNALSLTIKGLREFKYRRPSLILASSPPFYFAVSGLFLSKIFGIPLVLDYRDEWTLCPFDFTSKTKFDRWFEKRCIKHASSIFYTTKSHLNTHKNFFNIPSNKQKLIFNGWEESSKDIRPKNISKPDEQIKISYIGRLSGHVEPLPFISLLSKIIAKCPLLKNKVVLEFVGEKSNSIEDSLNEVMRQDLGFKLISTGQVSKTDAVQLMYDSDYLLMLCNTDLVSYIPGKLYDYLSSYVPVIAYGHAGEVSDILQQLKIGFFVQEGNEKELIKGLEANKSNLCDSTNLKAWLCSRTRRFQAERMFEELGKINTF